MAVRPEQYVQEGQLFCVVKELLVSNAEKLPVLYRNYCY